MSFLHVQNHQQPLHLPPSPPPPKGGTTTYNHLITLDLFHTPSPSSNFHIQLLQNYYSPIPFTSDHNFFSIKTGETISSSDRNRDLEEETKMSRRNGNGPKLDLKLNLSPPRANPHMPTPSRSATVSPTSPPSSCVSSELNQEDGNQRYSSSPESASMVLVGCPRCLMYVMLSEEDPRCPKCKSTVLLDVLQDNNNNNNSTKKTRN